MRGPTWPDPTRPDSTPWRFWEAYISGTGWPIHKRSSLFDVTIQVDAPENPNKQTNNNHSINFVFDRHRYPPVPATARGTCRVRGCRRHPTLDNSMTAGPIAFKFDVSLYVARDPLDNLALHKSEVGCICTCARAHPFSISCERLGGLCWNLVHG